MLLVTLLSASLAFRFASKITVHLQPSFPRWLIKQIHMAVAHHQVKPLNSKISTYMRNGLVEDAQKLFDEMPHRSTVTWNAMIRGYFQNRRLDRALQLFHRMPSRDIYSYNTVIAGLMCCGDVTGAKELFQTTPFRDVVTWNSMISGYIHNGMLDDALSTFNSTPVKDIVSWNLVIGGLVNSGELGLARKLFAEMDSRDIASWTIMVSGLVEAGLFTEACHLFDQMPERDARAWNKIIQGYVKHGDIDNASLLFQRMPAPNLDSWRILITGLASNRRFNDAMSLFFEMPDKCQKILNVIILGLIDSGQVKPAHCYLEKTLFTDLVSCTNLIVGYFGECEVESATRIFNEMAIRDVAIWNATIFGLGENDHGEEGLKLFTEMQESCHFPDKSTFTTVLKICSKFPSLEFGVQTHAQVIKKGFSNTTSISNAMLTMYARCGNMDSAVSEFRSMLTHDLISWNSIICGYAHHGDGVKAVEMFENMVLTDVKPNHITFVGVLSACCHAGLVEKGKSYFNVMRNKYMIEPTREHSTCLVDMLARHGLLEEAMEFLNGMREEGFRVPASVWGALLGACRMHRNVGMGEVAGIKVLEMEPWNSGVYLILAEMYMQNGKRGDAERILARMKVLGVKKQPACSWIQINNQWHVFLAADAVHPQFRDICLVLRLLHGDRGGSDSTRLSRVDDDEAHLILHGEV